MEKICKNCDLWKNKQAALNYNKFEGFCLGQLWGTSAEAAACARLFDEQNFKNDGVRIPVQHFESKMNPHIQLSRYHLCTDENFGCTRFKIDQELEKTIKKKQKANNEGTE